MKNSTGKVKKVNVYKSEQGKDKIQASYIQVLNTWSIKIFQESVVTRYGETHVIKSFDGKIPENGKPVLVMFHGVGDDSAIMWIYNFSKLSEHFNLIAIDTIGGPGLSVPNDEYFKSFSQVKWIDDIFEFYNLSSANILGVSYGAYLVQLYVAERSEKVDMAFALAGTLAAEGSANSMVKMMMAFLPEALFPTDKNIVKLAKKLCGENYEMFIKSSQMLEHWKCLLKYFNNKSMYNHARRLFNDEEIKSIRDKTIFMIGDADIISYSKANIEVMDKYKINYMVYKNVGHAINHEISQQINDEIIKNVKA